MNRFSIVLAILGTLMLGVVVCAENCTNDTDTDGDGICNDADNCINTDNPEQNDTDNDGVGNECDNCINISNHGQNDTDDDDVGDACDNCLDIPNSDQLDSDNDDIGNKCDNCPDLYNPDQKDSDDDGIGDFCDNCPDASNPDQENSDDDSLGDVCDDCTDSDYDNVCDDDDNCIGIANPDQDDSDGNGIGDACEDLVDDSNQSVTGSDISKLKIRLANIKATTPEEMALKDIAEKFIDDYTSKGAYELILNVEELLNTCTYFDKEWENQNKENIKFAAENIDRIYIKISESSVPVYGGSEYVEMFERVKKQTNTTYLEKISFVKKEIKKSLSDIRNSNTDKLNKENNKKSSQKRKEELLENIEFLNQNLTEKKKIKEDKAALLDLEKERHKKASDEYNNLKISVASGCSTNMYIGIFLGLVAGVLITYILKTESDYWSTYTSAEVLNPAIKALLVITVILIIIFALLTFMGINAGYCYL